MIAVQRFSPAGFFMARQRGQVRSLRSAGCRPVSSSHIGSLTVLTLGAESSARKHRKFVIRAMRQIPTSQSQIVLDVSSLPDDDSGISELVFAAVREAAHCRLDLAVSGINNRKLAQLELTKLSRLVNCFSDSSEAIGMMLQPTHKVSVAPPRIRHGVAVG